MFLVLVFNLDKKCLSKSKCARPAEAARDQGTHSFEDAADGFVARFIA